MRLIVFLIASLLSIINWGSTGHRALAEVASFYLTENAKNKINEILDGETIVTASMSVSYTHLTLPTTERV